MLTPSSRRLHRRHLHLFGRRLHLPLRLLPHLALVEGRHRQHDPKGLSRGILDVFCSCSMVRLAPIANASRMSREHWEAANVMQILKAGGLYFALVFGAGVALRTVRTLWVDAPAGTRGAELRGTPLLHVCTI